MDLLQPGDGAEKGPLDVLRQGGAHALHIVFVAVCAAGLQKELVPGLFRKAHHLVFNRRTVAGPRPVDDAAEQRRTVEGGPDERVGLLVGIGEPADGPVVHRGIPVEGKARLLRVAGLGLHFGEVQTPAGDPGGRPRLEPAEGKPQRLKAGRQVGGGIHPVWPDLPDHLAGEGLGPQISACGKDGGFTVVPGAAHQLHAADGPCFVRQEPLAFSLRQLQPRAALQRPAHIGPVGQPVGLCPGRIDRGALAPVQHPKLQTNRVGGPGHFAAQRVDLPHQLALGGAADGGIAGHIAHGVQTGADAQGAAAHPGGGQRGLDARVSRPHHHDIIGSGKKIQHEIRVLFVLNQSNIANCFGKTPIFPRKSG